MTSPNDQTEKYIEGRRHRVDTHYLLPKDDQEIDRLDFQHYGLKTLQGAIYKAPLDSQVKTILDVGSGTGHWMAEMSQEFPHASIEGVDVEPPAEQAQLSSLCHFTRCDVLQGLPFQYNTFEYVHQRLLVGGIPMPAWPEHIQELIRVLSSGGWLELLETGNVFHNEGPATTQLTTWWDQGAGSITFDRSFIATLGVLLSKYGLQNVHTTTLMVPLGKWGARSGELMGSDAHKVFTSMKGLYVRKLGVDAKEFDQAVSMLPEEWETHHTTCEFYNIVAQKG